MQLFLSVQKTCISNLRAGYAHHMPQHFLPKTLGFFHSLFLCYFSYVQCLLPFTFVCLFVFSCVELFNLILVTKIL